MCDWFWEPNYPQVDGYLHYNTRTSGWDLAEAVDQEKQS